MVQVTKLAAYCNHLKIEKIVCIFQHTFIIFALGAMTHSMRFDVSVAGWKLYTNQTSVRFNVSIAGWKLYTELDIYYGFKD